MANKSRDVTRLQIALDEHNLQERNLKRFLEAFSDRGCRERRDWVTHALCCYLRDFHSTPSHQIPSGLCRMHQWLHEAVEQGDIDASMFHGITANPDAPAWPAESTPSRRGTTREAVPLEPGAAMESNPSITDSSNSNTSSSAGDSESAQSDDSASPSSQVSHEPEDKESDADNEDESDWRNQLAGMM